ncbi:MAG: hypothetical protein JW850_16370 [Thermoflexales bacterium]|nr:hypothetical protein [Thermoflexales bacterium]
MNTLIRACVIFVAFLLILEPSSVAWADAAPPPLHGIGGLEPFQYQDTQVQMVSERVEMELLTSLGVADEDRYTSQIRVTAWFSMHNQGPAEETMQAVFPLGSFNECKDYSELPGPASYNGYVINPDTFVVQVNGEPITSGQMTTDYPSCRYAWLKMPWAVFDVTFPLDQDVLVRIDYVMDGGKWDAIDNIEYVLETGAGWKGPITQGDIILRYPQSISPEQVLPLTTPGYQILGNEMRWSFTNLEPTSRDNILISMIALETWQSIVSAREKTEQNPADASAWLELADGYWRISTPGKNVRDVPGFAQKADETYRLALATNSENADILAGYAAYMYERCDYCWSGDDDVLEVVAVLDKALTIDPSQARANELLFYIQQYRSQFGIPTLEYIPPPTFTPTATHTSTPTPLPTQTQTPTATESPTPRPSSTPTKAVEPSATLTVVPALSTSTPTIEPITSRVSVTATVSAYNTGGQSVSPVIVGGSAVLIMGALVSIGMIRKRKARFSSP